jgi:ubiquinone/menaquinone biosynthesis C-methylase UbiE
VTNIWDERAGAYRESDAHREGADLDLLVEWAAGARTALDVATGGGHVARRLREAGLEVVTSDSSPGMRPDVICGAEDLPFADGSFDVVACRVAAHHFARLEPPIAEMTRVARERVLIADNVFMGDEVEEAERLRDPSHVRNYSEDEWRQVLSDSGLAVEQVQKLVHPILFEPWLTRTGCEGEDAERVRALVAERLDGDHVRLDRIAFKTRKAG